MARFQKRGGGDYSKRHTLTWTASTKPHWVPDLLEPLDDALWLAALQLAPVKRWLCRAGVGRRKQLHNLALFLRAIVTSAKADNRLAVQQSMPGSSRTHAWFTLGEPRIRAVAYNFGASSRPNHGIYTALKRLRREQNDEEPECCCGNQPTTRSQASI